MAEKLFYCIIHNLFVILTHIFYHSKYFFSSYFKTHTHTFSDLTILVKNVIIISQFVVKFDNFNKVVKGQYDF